MTAALPPVAPDVLADAIESLSARLRKRLDDTAAKAAAWPVTAAADGTVTVQVDDETTVTLAPRDGAIRNAADAVCSCLLAPACLHRTAVLGLAPPLDADPKADAAAEADTAESAASQPQHQPKPQPQQAQPDQPQQDQPPLTAAQEAALETLRACAEELIDIGLVGAGLATEASLRRAAHTARAAGLYRAATTANRVASQLRAYRTQSRGHRLPDYTDDLRTLMQLLRAPESARGTARRTHEHQGGMRLSGFFSEPVISSTGMAGVVTIAADGDGTLWSVPALGPGDASRVDAAYKGPVGLGGAALSHRELVREGLIVSGASASADGSLSHGAGVRSVRASGATWWEAPLDALFAEPLAAGDPAAPPAGQFARVFGDAEPRAGSDLVFCEVRILPYVPGLKPGDVPVALGSAAAVLRSPFDHESLDFVENLKVLSRHPGLRLRIAARPDPQRPGILRPLAASPDPGQNGMALPESWHGRICLGLDRLHESMLRPITVADDEPGPPRPLARHTLPLHLLRSTVERTAAGGRRAARVASPDKDASALRAAGMPRAAEALDRLCVAARAPERDAFNRPIPDSQTAFATAWLAAGAFEAAASSALTVHAWSGAGSID